MGSNFRIFRRLVLQAEFLLNKSNIKKLKNVN